MLDILFWPIVFVVAIALLVKASDYFTEASEKIGVYLGIPSFVVGVTIVAFGTSFPELTSSLFSFFQGSSEIVAGNVVGSNIANILLVLGVSVVVARSFKITHEINRVDIPFLLSATFLFVLMALDGVFSWVEGIIFTAGLVLYIFYSYRSAVEGDDSKDDSAVKKKKEKGFMSKQLLILAVSLAGVLLGAKYTIDSVIEMSRQFSIGADIIAVFAVAIGTSLPELAVGISAAKKGNGEMAIGNVLGSNVFNIFAVMGIPAIVSAIAGFGALTISPFIALEGTLLMLFATLMFVFFAQDKEMTVWEGWLFIIAYAFFVLLTFGLV